MGSWTKEYTRYNSATETTIIVSRDHHGKWAWDLEESDGKRIAGTDHIFDTPSLAAKAAVKYHRVEFLREYVPVGLDEAAY